MDSAFTWKTPGIWERVRYGKALATVRATVRACPAFDRLGLIQQVSVELFKEALNAPRINAYFNFEPFCQKYGLENSNSNDPRAMVTAVLVRAGVEKSLASRSITRYLNSLIK
ncbi:hypothetical protein IPJ72_01780 [Candidatus Peregrinibacteria bacterium]|nr:MAG: hypothetical protein IPJ72_01780 [Candidatus Peregrinibacteria bacterium]